jgi:hypothetical protein
MNPSLDLLDNIDSPTANTLSAMSNVSMDSVDLLSSPGGGQIHEGNEQQPMSTNAPPQAAFEEQRQGETKLQPDGKLVLYQMEFDVDHLGKNKPASKRKASWQYGIKRISQSDNSIKIEEHEAQLTWSTHSGRWTVTVDGNDVYAGIAKGSVLDYKWKWNHRMGCVSEEDDLENNGETIVSMRIVACRKPPVRTSKDFRCYEFVIEGKPFRHLPSVNGGSQEMDFENESNDGKLTTILDIVEPTWRASGFA